ncbi:hypothetical protein GGS23DRAFT_374101 [Durotheca rogersii]|uniref:uncharacterized protein n=1 Tax=Durotheca rogersii TaxID=419775 RepID=UPI00221E9196|nr:uncharacterized protein GGS23DRAFT_374101 [Durotheca rogersii]KAI5866201.1 hypothetical protein GGS23DRAFT_374101 [Durotheca rogersii]
MPPGVRSYRSTAAPPQQQLFPPRRRHVKTYGRTRAAHPNPRQSTLTQMDFMSSPMPEEPLAETEDEEEKETDIEEPAEDTKPKRKGRALRRKTTGDELVTGEKPRDTKRRKTLGDAPSPIPSSNFHTQTLTQFLSAKEEEDDTAWQVEDSEVDDDLDFVMETPRKPETQAPSKTDESKPEKKAGAQSSTPSPIPSVTPTNRRTKAVIPSSHTPTTPMLMRYSPAPHDSPLTAKSTNVAALSPIIKRVQKTPGDRVIPDSYSTAHSSLATPTPKSVAKATSGRRIRFQLPEDKENITPGRTKPKSPKPLRKTPGRPPLREVPDSDDDLGVAEDDDDEETAGDDANVPTKSGEGHGILSTDEPEEPETYYGVIGDETQAQLLSSNGQLGLDFGGVGEISESSRSRSVTPTPKPKETPRTARSSSITAYPSAAVVEQPPLSSPQKALPSEKNTERPETQFYTQGPESQRLPLSAINALGPQTPNSDILVSLHPEPLAKILDRTKDHEFRSWKIPPSVCRVWIYSTRPFSELKYMCVLGPPKTPGEIQGEKGIGNAEFNGGKTVMKYAYEILQVYELNNPVSLDEMKRKGWVAAAPQKYTWVPPAVVGELTANLKCALFGAEGEEAHEADATVVPSSLGTTVSQELEAQLQGDLDYSTQHPSAEEDADEVVPSSQSPLKSTPKRTRSRGGGHPFTRPARPSSSRRPGPASQAAPAPPSQRRDSFVRPSQATTVSSPAVSPEMSLPRETALSREPSASVLHSSSPAPYRSTRHSLRSSQFLTRSQMLPDSLVNDEIQEPPPIIWDSADEQSD